MNDGPGLSAWDLANARLAPLDLAANERLARQLAREDDPEYLEEVRLAEQRRIAARGMTREQRSRAKLASVPHWPNWAKHPAHCPTGMCPGCHGSVTDRGATGICHVCGKRAGRHLQRMALAWRQFRAGEWKP